MDDTRTKTPSPKAMASASPSPGSLSSATAPGKRLEEIIIEVRPAANIPDPPPSVDTEIQCTLTQRGQSNGGKLNGQIIELDYGMGPFCIRFKLEDGLDWRDGDPFWISQGSSCPAPNALDNKQIWLDKKPKNKTLTILDMNVDAHCILHYRLNFKDNLYFDPEIRNGGGGTL